MWRCPKLSVLFPTCILGGSMIIVATESRHGSYGLCRVYSYNIQLSSSSFERHFFVCCADAGDEVMCHDETLQSPRRQEEFCRGELIDRDGILRHWTEDTTDMFTGGDLLYCGGCCGQHVAMKTCNKHLTTTGEGKPLQVGALPGDTVNVPGSGCDDWIDCFVYQCQKIAADILANRPLKCSVPPPPYPKHFLQQRRALPFNLTAILQAQLSRSTDHDSTDQRSVTGHSALNGCDRHACYQLDSTSRCSNACCQHSACCLSTDRQSSAGLLYSNELSLTVTLSILCVFFVTVTVIFSLLLVHPKDHCRHPVCRRSPGGTGRLHTDVSENCDDGQMLVVVDCKDQTRDDVVKPASDDDSV